MTIRAPHSSAVPAALRAALAERYELEAEVSRGGMASVYRARDRKHGRLVAVKVLRPDVVGVIGAERFLREIAITAQFGHPHVLTLIDSGEIPDDGTIARTLYYVMPFVEGESLRERLARDGRLSVAEVVRLLRDVVDALAYAHRRAVVHRDVKPENILLAEQHALVVDFGIAKAMSRAGGAKTLTGVGMSLGTPAYMAPEQAAADGQVDHRADIYAAGVIAYEMLAGRPPFVGPPQAVLAAHVTTPPAPIDGVRPDVPRALARAVMRCLEKDPAARFQRADELLAVLESLAPAEPRAPRRRALLGGTAAIVLAVAALLALALLLWIVVRARRERTAHATASASTLRAPDATTVSRRGADYSARSVTLGSTCAARRAGTTLASAATSSSTPATAPYTDGSVADSA